VVIRLLRFASISICLLLIASFAVFAIGQAKEGSLHQQQELGAAPAAASTPARSAPQGQSSGAGQEEGTLHKALTDVFNKLTSPFAGLVSSSSEWATRAIKLVLALLVYGFGLGYLARVLRVRV